MDKPCNLCNYTAIKHHTLKIYDTFSKNGGKKHRIMKYFAKNVRKMINYTQYVCQRKSKSNTCLALTYLSNGCKT